jgi:glucose-1-phosphate thymidylyltransferase
MPVGNRPIVSHALRALTTAGITDVAFIGRAAQLPRLRRALAAETVGRSGIRYIEHSDRGGPAEALRLAGTFLQGSPGVVQFADILLSESVSPLVASLARGSCDALVLVKKGLGVANGNGRSPALVKHLSNGDGGWSDMELVDFYVFGREAARTIAELGTRPAIRSLAAVVEDLLEHGHRVQTHCVRGSWRYRGGDDELLEANRFILDGISSDIPPESVRNSQVQGRAVIHPTARLSSALVRGPVVIGAGARIRRAYIGPYTSVGEGVLVEGAEVEHSILLPGARIAHPGLRLEASVVGAGARVIHSARRPTAVRMNLPDRAVVSLT